MLDDFIYFSTLTASIAFGSYYRKIEGSEEKRNYGTGLGIMIALLICGRALFHTILMIWVNIFIFRFCNRSYVHKASLTYTWLHLLYIHIFLVNAGYVVWLHQNIALRLVGLAFDLHSVSEQNAFPSSLKLNKFFVSENMEDLTAIDIISYSFFFIGLHKGPYYTWRTYNQQLQSSFSDLGDCREITEQKLKKAFVCFVGYMFLNMKFNPRIYYDNTFYHKDPDTRYLYNLPLLIMYVLKKEVIMLLCTSVCTEAGFGMYPRKCLPVPGHGPTSRPSLLRISDSEELALNEDYNFAMLRCYDNQKLLFGPRMTDTLRSWDMPIRYWFWANIYNGLFRAGKEIKSICSFLAYTLWNGPSLQQMIISSTLWVYINLEKEYSYLYDTSGSMKLPWNFGFSIMRIFCLIYLTPCFIVNDPTTLLRYYYSIFWIFHVLLIVLIVGAIVVYKSRSFNSFY